MNQFAPEPSSFFNLAFIRSCNQAICKIKEFYLMFVELSK